MQTRLTRAILLLYGVLTGLAIGLWPLLDPPGFYADFPGGPWHGWVAMDGPYNEHLIRDFAGLNLAVAAVAIGSAALGGTAHARLVGVALLLFGCRTRSTTGRTSTISHRPTGCPPSRAPQ
jgi:hypothetical protein